MIILSGPEKSSYNRFANDIVKVLGEKDGIKLLIRPTGGSSDNFKAITDPVSLEKIAFIQSDYFNLMIAEDKLNNTNKTGSLKVVLQLATEEMHFVAKKSSGFVKLQDLENKKVAAGTEDQGSLATAKIIKGRSKINWNSYYSPYEQILKDLKEDRIDAFFIVGTAPVNMIDIDPQIMVDGGTLLALEDFNGWARYYENDTVYKSDYKWLDKDIPTFGVRTLLVVNEAKLTDAEKKTIGAIKSSIIKNLDVLEKQGHPKWKEVIIPDEPEVISVKSPEAAKTTSQANSGKADAITFRVQIYSRNYEKKDDQVTVNGKNYLTYVYSFAGAYRYTIGEFADPASAAELQKLCRGEGYSQAFVAAFKNNVRSTDPTLFK
jgi:TRAP transporter TAXI family solute receptor